MNDKKYAANTIFELTQTKYFTFIPSEKDYKLACGKQLPLITIAYETYGKLNSDKNNAILICHALTGDAHVAGFTNNEDKKPGWWDTLVGAGKAFDTEKYFIICSNVLGSCYGSTGPASINPETNQIYAMIFPVVTIKDMVRCQKYLIEHLGVNKLLSVVGGSMGGMQVLQWAIEYPELLYSAIPIATTSKLTAQNIAFNEVGRQAIVSDPNWQNGNYHGISIPTSGLSIARMIAHITYLSDISMRNKFGRNLQYNENLNYDFSTEFQVESYLHYQGDIFVKRFDANTYLYLTKAMDYFDLSIDYGTLNNAFKNAKNSFLIVSFSSDWLFPPYQSFDIVKALKANNVPVSYCEISSNYGHDAFLLEFEQLSDLIDNFLNNLRKKIV